MDRHHISQHLLHPVLQVLERRFGELKMVERSHWKIWYHAGQEVAGLCDSPYPGPEYGSSFWVRSDLVDMIQGSIVYVPRSRYLTNTEAHIINERLRDAYYGRKNDRIQLLPEVEEWWYNRTVRAGLQEVTCHSVRFDWKEPQQLRI